MLYRTSLKRYNRNNYEGDMLNCSTDKLSQDGIEYVCTFCHKSLKQNKLPSLAVNNHLELSEVPYEIDHLNSLKYIFISRQIPFMKLLALPRGKRKAVHGCVVNVPIEPDQLASVLPRVPSADTFITVKLKRKLKYRGHSYIRPIIPQKLNDALHILKKLKYFLYEDVVLNENWIEDSCNVDPELWGSHVQNNQLFSNHENKEQSTDEDSDTEDELEDNRSKLSGIPFDLCVQPKDIVDESVLSIAHGEGKRPISFAQDKYAEEMAFPQLFPTGKFGLSHERPTKLSMKKYFQDRLLNCDEEAKEVYDSISLSLRKGKQQHTSAGDLKTRVAEFARTDLGIHFMQKIRGSPAFYNKMFYDLLGMIRQLGPCTLDTLILLHVENTEKTCRFAFPRPPLDETLVLKPLEKVYSKALTSVSEQLVDVEESTTLQEILDKVEVTKELYLNALHRIKTKSGQPAALLKRKPFSYVTNVYSCVMYLASYVSKPEKTLGDVLRSVSESSKHLGIHVANKFLTHREQQTCQKTVLDCLSPRKYIKEWMTMMRNLFDRTSYKPPTDDSDLVQVPQQSATKITLKDGQGFMIKRNKPAIIRTHQWSVKKQPEHYYHAKLLLYHPWRNETNDLLIGTYQENYEFARESVLQNTLLFEHNADELANVLEDIDENGFANDHWVTVAPET
ncbi:hypothetical protein MAR_026757 [Mya arenaria]|uniref:DUF6570 domain-containing protein n=1 Tax=Mya arenaria TaxID=6604 RepID=A0ABY7ERF6_MYAAR|nr:hypothetical protein MAR_026757 [Mya arenaria]